MTFESKETSPKSSSRVLIPILFAAVLIFFLIIIALRAVHNIKGELLVYWDDDGLKICSASDGPFVVTHLYASGAEGKITAAFDPPIAIIDSAGRYFTKEEINKMEWLSYLSEPTNPPSADDDIKVFFYIPQQKQSRQLR